MTYASPEVHMQPIIKSSHNSNENHTDTSSFDDSSDENIAGNNETGDTDDSDNELGADDVMSHKIEDTNGTNDENKAPSDDVNMCILMCFIFVFVCVTFLFVCI